MQQISQLVQALRPAIAVFIVAELVLLVTDENIVALAGALFAVGAIVGRITPKSWISAMLALVLAGAVFGVITSSFTPHEGQTVSRA